MAFDRATPLPAMSRWASGLSFLSMARVTSGNSAAPVAPGAATITIIAKVRIVTERQIIVHVRRSKTDQEGAGRKVGIPYGWNRWCPVSALNEWLEIGGIEDGPVFHSVDRHGNAFGGRLSGEAVSLIIKARVTAVDLAPEEYSGHSLRARLATSAVAAGVSSWKIRQQTGHASDGMLAKYIRDGELFVNNAVNSFL